MKYKLFLFGLFCSLLFIFNGTTASAETNETNLNIPNATQPTNVSDQSTDKKIVETFTTPLEAAEAIEQELQTGSLIFTKGDCLAVRIYTRSPYTHVAATVKENGKTYVYDSMNPMGVRKLPLEEYLSSQLPDELHLLHPVHVMTSSQVTAFQHALTDKIGTPYGVKHYLTGNRAKGVHCAEYVTDALAGCNLMHANNPPKVSPASLLTGGVRAGLYHPVRTFAISSPKEELAHSDVWYEQLWLDTKHCTQRYSRKVSKLVLCH